MSAYVWLSAQSQTVVIVKVSNESFAVIAVSLGLKVVHGMTRGYEELNISSLNSDAIFVNLCLPVQP